MLILVMVFITTFTAFTSQFNLMLMILGDLLAKNYCIGFHYCIYQILQDLVL